MISKITKDKIINNDNLIVPIAYDEYLLRNKKGNILTNKI